MIELNEAKIHLGIELDETWQDPKIESLLPVAKLAVENYLNRKIYTDADELASSSDETGIVATDDIKHGIKLFITHFFENPSITSEMTVKSVPNLNYLLDSYRVYNA